LADYESATPSGLGAGPGQESWRGVARPGGAGRRAELRRLRGEQIGATNDSGRYRYRQ